MKSPKKSKKKKRILDNVSFHLNHYKHDAPTYSPIINRLKKEGWRIDRIRSGSEKIGTFVFKYVWLTRKFYK